MNKDEKIYLRLFAGTLITSLFISKNSVERQIEEDKMSGGSFCSSLLILFAIYLTGFQFMAEKHPFISLFDTRMIQSILIIVYMISMESIVEGLFYRKLLLNQLSFHGKNFAQITTSILFCAGIYQFKLFVQKLHCASYRCECDVAVDD